MGHTDKETILDIAEFLGDEMTEDQAVRLMDLARLLAPADVHWLYERVPGGHLLTHLSMWLGESGGTWA